MMPVLIIMCFALFHVLSRTVEALDYTDIINLNANCTVRDSCLSGNRSSNFSDQNCACDNFCSAFGDCCIDAFSSNRYRDMKLSCMAFGMDPNHGAYVIDKCPRRYAGPLNIRNKCEMEDDFTDPFASTPVTSLPVGITYRNRYCAECNKAKVASLRSWDVNLTCDSLSPYYEEINQTFVWNNIEYRMDMNGWGVEYRNEFHFCDILFDKPHHLPSSKVRLCKANAVSTCPSNWENEEVRRACESYTAVVLDVSTRSETGEDTMFKNPHCALCNGKITSRLRCSSINGMGRKSFSFGMLVDVNRSNGDIVGQVQRCPYEEVYDSFFKKCRSVKCVIPGYTLVNGNCVKT